MPLKLANQTLVLRLKAVLASALLATPSVAADDPNPRIVISQIYGGGGNADAPYTHDFVELHNISAISHDVTGWSIQYASASGTSWQVTPLEGIIPAGGYFLIQQASNAAVGDPLPEPVDAVGTSAMAATRGKVALATTTSALSGADPQGPLVVDFVGYGAANAAETVAAPAASATLAISRLDSGSTDTDHNAADFTTGAPLPRNGASPPYLPIEVIETPGPTVVAIDPAHGSSDVPISGNLRITFTENISPAPGGTIHLRTVANPDTNLRSFDVNDADDVILLENFHIIDLLLHDSLLAHATPYFIVLPEGTFVDDEGNVSDAFGSPETSAFTTVGLDTTPPTLMALVPENGSEHAGLTSALRLTFDEPIAIGTGSIRIRSAANQTIIEAISAAEEGWWIEGNEVSIRREIALVPGESYYVEMDAGALVDLAGNPFAGLTGAAAWSFTTGTLPVVVNKYLNSGVSGGVGDLVELLVVADLDPGSTVDMRGMILKDFTSSMGADGGGKYTLSDEPFWEAIPAGAQIVITVGSTESSDVSLTDASPFVLRLGLLDETYFAKTGSGTFDIAGTDMVMIKAAGSDPAGVVGGIHALAAGDPGSHFYNYGGNKLRAAEATPTHRGVIAACPSSALSNFSGLAAEGGLEIGNLFGLPNNGTNGTFLAALRGLEVSQGNGVAVLVNATPASPFTGTPIFGRGLAEQAAMVTVTANAPAVTLTTVSFELPSELGTPAVEQIALSGNGAAEASAAVSGQLITISSAAVTVSDPLVVTLGGLTTPTPEGIDADGIFPILVSTSGTDAPPAPIAAQAALRVLVPIASLRDNVANGLPVDLGKQLAVEGVVTADNFSLTGTNAFLQDHSAGINMFAAELDADLSRGSRIAVLGTVASFRGLTELVFDSLEHVIEIGTDSEPSALTLSLEELVADPEAYEGLLVRVPNLSRDPSSADPWVPNQTLLMRDPGGTTLNLRLQNGISPGEQPQFPVTITGIWGQHSSNSTAPFNGGYQLQPRDERDFEPGDTVAGGYAEWAAANGVAHEPPSADSDGDGLAHLIEYALGFEPTIPDRSPGKLESGVIHYFKGVAASADEAMIYSIQTSTTLAPGSWETVASAIDTPASIQYALPTGHGPIFVRLSVTQNP